MENPLYGTCGHANEFVLLALPILAELHAQKHQLAKGHLEKLVLIVRRQLWVLSAREKLSVLIREERLEGFADLQVTQH
jgi:hypothetical protein